MVHSNVQGITAIIVIYRFKLVKFSRTNKIYKAIHLLAKSVQQINIDRFTTLIASYYWLYWKHNYKIEDGEESDVLFLSLTFRKCTPPPRPHAHGM